MRRRTFHACVLGGLALSLALTLSGCKKEDTILLIELYGPAHLEPWQFRATIFANEARVIELPKPPQASPLPQSFSLALDRSHTGPITVDIRALGENTFEIASGITTQRHIVIGGQTVIAVELTEEMPPDVDGGAGDGATGQDAAADNAEDGMGLEDATD